MLETHQKWRMTDESKENEFFMEVNWDQRDQKTNQCKLVRFTFPNGQSCLIKKEYLLGALFTMGTKEEQVKMVPHRNLTVKWYETMLGVKATKDIRKGEMINFPIKLTLPTIEEEAIAELKAKYEKNFKHQ